MMFNTKAVDYDEIKKREYIELLYKYRRTIEELNLVDNTSERFDALCLDLKSINHRIAAVKKELNDDMISAIK